jgi:hypothetical protein
MEDKTQQLFNLLNESKDFKGAFKTPEELTATLSDETKVGALYSLLNESADFKGAFNSIDEFKTSFDIKKKSFFTRCAHFCFGQRGTSFIRSVRAKATGFLNSTITVNIG